MDLSNPKEISVPTYYTTSDQLKASIIPAYEALYTESNGNVTDYTYWMAHLSSDKDLLGTRKYCRDIQLADYDNDINERLMRYADVLLMYAECLNEDGKETEAKTYINMVRSRANNIVPTEQTQLWYQHSPGTIPDVDGLLASNVTINGINKMKVWIPKK